MLCGRPLGTGSPSCFAVQGAIRKFLKQTNPSRVRAEGCRGFEVRARDPDVTNGFRTDKGGEKKNGKKHSRKTNKQES